MKALEMHGTGSVKDIQKFIDIVLEKSSPTWTKW